MFGLLNGIYLHSNHHVWPLLCIFSKQFQENSLLQSVVTLTFLRLVGTCLLWVANAWQFWNQFTGQLPFLTHEQRTVSSLGSIIKYVAGLKTFEPTRSNFNLDASLNSTEKSQTTSWCAHVESNLGDVLSCVFYSSQDNWVKLTHPALVSLYPLPHRYYVPGRIREMYKPRLESAGLWDLPTKEEEKKLFRKDIIKQKDQNTKMFQEAFGREKVLEKARACLDIYARLLSGRDFIFKDRPTTLDVVLAAYILLLLDPEFPDPSVQNLLKDRYPALASHARRVFDHVTSSPESQLKISSPSKFAWSSLVPWPPVVIRKQQLSEEDLHFRRMRWGFYGLTLGTMVVYLITTYRTISRRVARDVTRPVTHLKSQAATMDEDLIVVDDVDAMEPHPGPSTSANSHTHDFNLRHKSGPEHSMASSSRLRSGSHNAYAETIERTTRSSAYKNKPQPKLKLKLSDKAAAQAPGMSFLGQYDRELDSDDEDLAFEEQFILRMPPGEDLEKLKKMVASREVGNDVWFKFKDSRRAVFHIGNSTYSAKLVDLPCIIESQKTLDNKQMFKVADICQMLVVDKKLEADEPLANHKNFNIDEFIWPHGITPPLHHVRKRRFRKRVNRRTIESVEQEVERLLDEDALASEVKYEILDNVNPDLSDSEFMEREEPVDAPTPAISDMGEPQTPGYDMGDEEDEREEDAADEEGGEGDIDEELAAELDLAMADEDEDDEGDGDDEDDEESEEEEEDEDDDDEDVQARKLINEEVRDLEAAVAKKGREVASSANPLIKKRFEDALKKLTADLEMKLAQRDELKEKQRMKKEGIAAMDPDTDPEGDAAGGRGVDAEDDEDLFGSDDRPAGMDMS
ncbi:hypothetical protein C0991_003945 [Blastosporella zonata]|nr:hypothetical protein C0991_003945 [Blastosporella zonata]